MNPSKTWATESWNQVGKDLQGLQSPIPGFTQDHPKSRPWVWEWCPNAPWTPVLRAMPTGWAACSMPTALWGRAFSLHCSQEQWHESSPDWSKLLRTQQYPHKGDFIFCGLVAIPLNGGNVSHNLRVTHFAAEMFQKQTMKHHYIPQLWGLWDCSQVMCFHW